MGRHIIHPPLTQSQKEFILNNYLCKTVKEMTMELKLPNERNVYRFLYQEGLDTFTKNKRVKSITKGMFNEREFDNWLA